MMSSPQKHEQLLQKITKENFFDHIKLRLVQADITTYQKLIMKQKKTATNTSEYRHLLFNWKIAKTQCDNLYRHLEANLQIVTTIQTIQANVEDLATTTALTTLLSKSTDSTVQDIKRNNEQLALQVSNANAIAETLATPINAVQAEIAGSVSLETLEAEFRELTTTDIEDSTEDHSGGAGSATLAIPTTIVYKATKPTIVRQAVAQ